MGHSVLHEGGLRRGDGNSSPGSQSLRQHPRENPSATIGYFKWCHMYTTPVRLFCCPGLGTKRALSRGVLKGPGQTLRRRPTGRASYQQHQHRDSACRLGRHHQWQRLRDFCFLIVQDYGDGSKDNGIAWAQTPCSTTGSIITSYAMNAIVQKLTTKERQLPLCSGDSSPQRTRMLVIEHGLLTVAPTERAPARAGDIVRRDHQCRCSRTFHVS